MMDNSPLATIRSLMLLRDEMAEQCEDGKRKKLYCCNWHREDLYVCPPEGGCSRPTASRLVSGLLDNRVHEGRNSGQNFLQFSNHNLRSLVLEAALQI